MSEDGRELSLQMWDTAGQERFRSMAPLYYRGAKAALLVFDVSKEETFHRMVTWLKDLKASADAGRTRACRVLYYIVDCA